MTERQKKQPFHTRLSPETIRLLKLLVEKTGLTMTGSIELAVRELAERKKLV